MTTTTDNDDDEDDEDDNDDAPDRQKKFFFHRCSPRHVRIFYFKSVAAALYRLDERRWIYKEKRRRVFRANLFAVQTINDDGGFP